MGRNTLLDALTTNTAPATNSLIVPVGNRPTVDSGLAFDQQDGEMLKGFRRASGGIVSGGMALKAAVEDLWNRDQAARDYAAAQQYAQDVSLRNPAEVQSLKDVTLGNALQYGAGAIGEAIPSVALAMVGGRLGSKALGRVAPNFVKTSPLAAEMLGGAGVMMPLESGETAMGLASDPISMANTTAKQRLGIIAGKGAVNSVLEAAVPAMLGNKLAGGELMERVAKGQGLKHIAKVAAQGTIGEGATEGAQELVGTGAHMLANPSVTVDPWQIADAAVKGGLPGAAMGAVGGVSDVARSRLTDGTPSDLSAKAGEKVLDGVAGAGDVLGKGAAKAAGLMDRWAQGRRVRDSGEDFLHTFITPVNSEDPSELEASFKTRLEAGARYAKSVLNNPDAHSDKELEDAHTFLGAVESGVDPTKAFGDYWNNVRESTKNRDLRRRMNEIVDDINSRSNRRGNAQTPAEGTEISPDDNTMTQMAKLWMKRNKDVTDVFQDLHSPSDETLNGAKTILGWIRSNFGADHNDGKPFVPKSIAENLGEHAPRMVLDAYESLVTQGLMPRNDKLAKHAVAAIEAESKSSVDRKKIITDSLTPLAREGVSPSDVHSLDKALKQYVRLGTDSTKATEESPLNPGTKVTPIRAELERTFGPQLDKVLEAYGKDVRPNEVGSEYKRDYEIDPETGEIIDYAGDVNSENEKAPKVQYHGAFDIDHPEYGRKVSDFQNRKQAELPNSDLKVVGEHAALKEQFDGDAQGLRDAEDALITKRAPDARLNPADKDARNRLLKKIDGKWKTLREETMDDSDGLTQINLKDLKPVTGKKNADGKVERIPHTANNGFLFLERSDGTMTPTTSSKLLALANKAGVDTGGLTGAEAIKAKVLHALGAVLTQEGFTGRIGTKDSDTAVAPTWTTKNKIPENFTYTSDITEADTKTPPKELTDAEKKSEVRRIADYIYGFDEAKSTALRALTKKTSSTKDGFARAMRELGIESRDIGDVHEAATQLENEAQQVYEQGREGPSDTDPMLRRTATERDDVVPSELAPDGNKPIVRNKLDGTEAKPEPTGALVTGNDPDIVKDLKTKEAAKGASVTEDQVAWVKDALGAKGVPAFVKKVLDTSFGVDKRKAVVRALRQLADTLEKGDLHTKVKNALAILTGKGVTSAKTEVDRLKNEAKVARRKSAEARTTEDDSAAVSTKHRDAMIEKRKVDPAKLDPSTPLWAVFESDGDDGTKHLVAAFKDLNTAQEMAKRDGLNLINDVAGNLVRKGSAQETFSGKLGSPVFTARKDGRVEDQALVEKLIERGYAGRNARAVEATDDSVGSNRLARIGAKFGKKVIWVEGLNGDGLSLGDRIYLDPDSGRSAQVLAAHELTHNLERDHPKAFADLVGTLRSHIDPEQWEDFVQRSNKVAGEKLSAETLRSELVANLVSDYAYRQHESVVRDEDAERGVDFKGYGQYLNAGSQSKVGAAIERFLAAAGHGRDSFASAQTPGKAQEPSGDTKAQIRAEIEKTLGDKIKLAFAKLIKGPNGEAWSGEWSPQRGIRIALGALDPLGVARHESIHQLFQWLREAKADGIQDLLKTVATNKIVNGQLRRLLANDKNALKQLEDPEEAAAYLYQFWKAGAIKLGPKAETFFQKVANFLRTVTGLLSKEMRDAKRAEAILTAFSEGAMSKDHNAVIKALEQNEQVQRAVAEQGIGAIKAFRQNKTLQKIAFTAASVLEDTKNPAFMKLSRLFHTPEGEKMGKQGLFEATAQQRAHYLNKLRDILHGNDREDIGAALKHLQSKTELKNIHDPVVNKIVKDVRSYLNDMYEYMQSRGMKRFDEETHEWVPIPKIETNFFPVVMDIEALMKDPGAFTQRLLEVHPKELEHLAKQANEERLTGQNEASLLAKDQVPVGREITPEDIAEAILKRMTESAGAKDITESTSSLGITPYAKSVNKRTLYWLDHSKFTDFMEKDLVRTLTNYTVQVVKRGEYVSRLGQEGELINDTINEAYTHELFNGNAKQIAAAQKKLKVMEAEWKTRKGEDPSFNQTYPTLRQAADSLLTGPDTEQRINAALAKMEMPIKAIMAGEGTIGKDIDPNLRTLIGGVTAYQNARLMALSLFTSFADPLGIMVRGGEMSDAFNAFTRGVKEVWSGWRGEFSTDEASKLAEEIGTVDAGTFLDALGETYSSVYVQGKLKKFNDTLFNLNGMEAWNRAMRISATWAAKGFIERHLTRPNEHSNRYLKEELNLDTSDKTLLKDGKLDTSREDVRQAIMRWVDGAILRPNAMQRPIMASDPHYALFYHLKQFTYSFHKTILKRAYVEAQHGNYLPASTLIAGYVPVMVAADVMKELIVPGDDPEWLKGGLGSYVRHGVSRANLLGIPQIGLDAMSNPFSEKGSVANSVERGAGILGPQVDQVAKILANPFDDKRGAVDDVVAALPGTTVLSRMAGTH